MPAWLALMSLTQTSYPSLARRSAMALPLDLTISRLRRLMTEARQEDAHAAGRSRNDASRHCRREGADRRLVMVLLWSWSVANFYRARRCRTREKREDRRNAAGEDTQRSFRITTTDGRLSCTDDAGMVEHWRRCGVVRGSVELTVVVDSYRDNKDQVFDFILSIRSDADVASLERRRAMTLPLDLHTRRLRRLTAEAGRGDARVVCLTSAQFDISSSRWYICITSQGHTSRGYHRCPDPSPGFFGHVSRVEQKEAPQALGMEL